MPGEPPLIVGAAIGDCVHVAGVHAFLDMARREGYRTRFLGPATPLPRLVEEAGASGADIVAVSYRLTPEAARRLLSELGDLAAGAGIADRRFVFGGTGPVCEVARATGLFEAVFGGGSTPADVLAFLRGSDEGAAEESYAGNLVERIGSSWPRPLIRHHFGQPTMEATLEGIRHLADSRVLDIISIGPDQNAQAHFFHPGDMDPAQDGAGGVPVRSESDFRALHAASRTGNHPLLRCYSGTRDILKMAAVLVDTIGNAWCAVPLTWYSVLDGRGRRNLPDAIREAQAVISWHGRRGIPVEVNEAHQWSLRGAHDSVGVATAYIAAHNARRAGARDYVAQFMFNTPPGLSAPMDLAKMLAKIDLLSTLEDDDFRVWRMTRSGLASFPEHVDRARGQLAASVYLQMAVRPHIVHVVGYSEASHAATADDIIGSCHMAWQVIGGCLAGMPDMTLDPAVTERREQLVSEARVLLEAVSGLAEPGVEDPLSDVDTLVKAVALGYLDAPDLAGNPVARGLVTTSVVDGACLATDHDTGLPMAESARIRALRDRRAAAT